MITKEHTKEEESCKTTMSHSKCPICFGNGYYSIWEYRFDNYGYPKLQEMKVSCPNCGGSGMIIKEVEEEK